jgi:hypothetical protein
MTALSARLHWTSEPDRLDVARLGALACLIGRARMRKVAAAAVRALGASPTRTDTWAFAWHWWYQRATWGGLAYQADQLTPAWAERHVEVVPASLPDGGCILISIHHFQQRLAFARLSTLVEELGGVSRFEPLPPSDPDLTRTSLGVDAQARLRARSRFAHQVFGPRVYSPRTAPRRGLELLRRGGSLIVLSDFFGRQPVCVLGKRMLVPLGPLWWAAQSGRPIVPFVLSPTSGERHRWRLWCGQPIAPKPTELAGALEECIRRSPTAWTGWQPWYEAPDFAS